MAPQVVRRKLCDLRDAVSARLPQARFVLAGKISLEHWEEMRHILLCRWAAVLHDIVEPVQVKSTENKDRTE